MALKVQIVITSHVFQMVTGRNGIYVLEVDTQTVRLEFSNLRIWTREQSQSSVCDDLWLRAVQEYVKFDQMLHLQQSSQPNSPI